MYILGLTGSIGMGKSTVAAMFRARGVPVHDADAEVHRLYGRGGAAVGPVGEFFPEAVVDDAIDRKILSSLVVGNEGRMRRLEEIVHPLVQSAERAFLDEAHARGARIVVLEVPLLLEAHGEERVDAVVVVSAPAEVQRARVLSRPGMSEAKFLQILARQVGDPEKRRRAHFIVDTGGNKAQTAKEVDDVLLAVAGRPGSAYARRIAHHGPQAMRGAA